uniref:Uncharacterized protein n=1 Tax=Phlebotomus papatasi TaxID=29031 RepID=A0A1B0DQC8_PHLPP
MEGVNKTRICRACQIKTEEDAQKIFIFTTVKLPDIFKETTSLDIHENDELPKVLCSTCYDRLLEAYNFRKMCSAAVLHFQKILSMEEKYIPPKSLSDIPLTNGTRINMNENSDMLDAPNSPLRNLNSSPDKEDSLTDSSDILSIDENLPEIFKTDPNDDVMEEENVHSERLDDVLVSRKIETSNTSPENYHPAQSDDCQASSNTPGDELQAIPNDDDPLISKRLRGLRNTRNKEYFLPGKPTKLECKYCHTPFQQKWDLDMHIWKEHLGLETCKCTVCGREFKSSNSLNNHLKTHKATEATDGDQESEKQQLCGICGMEKASATELNRHMKSHKKNNLWACVFCHYKTDQKCTLLRHTRVVHQGKKDYQCPRCDKSFTGSVNLGHHILRHEGVKNYVCKVCGAKKVTKSELTNHMLSHADEKMHICQLCPMKFHLRHSLKQHVKVVHHRIKEYECSVCKKSFGAAKNLKNHFMTHTGERPHACTQCPKTYIALDQLKIHMTTHTGGNKCPQCKKILSSVKSLKYHMTTHTEERPYHCDECGKRFKQKFPLKKHINTHLKSRKKPKIQGKSKRKSKSESSLKS